MTKAELIKAIAEKAGVTNKQAEDSVGAFFEIVTTEALGGEKVAWPGFGSFSVTDRPARTGRNPQTGEPVQIAASKAMKFSASSTLKQTLNK